MCPATVWIFQSSGVVAKMTQLRLWSSFHEHGSGFSSRVLGFHECGSGSRALFFHGSASVRFHINILIVLVCLYWKVKWIKSSAQN